jgi:hypothetical protein
MATKRTFMGIPVPQPSTEHTLTSCDVCDGDGWIGPAQLMAYTFNGGELVCYWCLFAEMKATGADLEIQSLDASADGKPRRT